ncbi:MAG: hypothetical protein H0U84_07945 [Thermoleophilaceae bacterium]|nr:hypothetical protein [Thermoleophilaceae bacterium]
MAEMTEAYDWRGRTMLDSHGEVDVVHLADLVSVRMRKETITEKRTVSDNLRKQGIVVREEESA